MAVLRTFSPDMEEVSIDEAYMDLTGLNRVSRATGITLKDLVFGPEKQPSLFGATEREDDKISRLIDTLEQKFGKSVLKYGA